MKYSELSDDPTAIAAMPPLPEFRLRGMLWAALMWLAYTLVYALALVNTMGLSFFNAFMSQALLHSLAALCSIPVWLLVVRTMDTVSWKGKIAAHLLLGPLYAIVVYQLYLFCIGILAGRAVQQEIMETAGIWMELANIMIYLVQFGVYHSIRTWHKLRYEQRRSTELRNLARDRELVALKSQINPHFLFNTLNSISAMVTRDTNETRRMLSQLAELMRYSLDMAEHDLVPLRRELDIIHAYLDLEQKRLGNRLRTHFDIGPQLEDVLLPPLVLQPLVENAIKHGIAPHETGGTIWIGLARAGIDLRCTVQDNGMGLARDQNIEALLQKGTGLQNTHKRLKQRFGDGAGLALERVEPQGVKVTMTLPIVTTQAKGSVRGH